MDSVISLFLFPMSEVAWVLAGRMVILMGGGRYINATSPAAFAFQIGAGISDEVNDKLSVDLGYRFKGMTDINPTVTTNWSGPDHQDQSTLGAHYFQIGAILRFRFRVVRSLSKLALTDAMLDNMMLKGLNSKNGDARSQARSCSAPHTNMS